MKTCEVKLYNARGLFYACQPTEGIIKDGITPKERTLGEHLETPRFTLLEVDNDTGYILGIVKDLRTEPLPYKIRVWVLAEYEPEKL
ncbi:hypothetical protein JMN32_05345 [Fulvivirga sp. 29W222]|uniref:Uncharacterized protein n=1 Tax=Fulvivirga marina TaxID=2494733 RepID=A0A937FVG1_9BACT|nr:hypothetical protein [Fulvivirga marina]MBL6445723.1 hypothetical protein [Fulvivirga marina]